MVYKRPHHGMIYFIKGLHLREFGFPRTPTTKKRFKWKKMNFTTQIPKDNPVSTYLVATGKDSKSGKSYRMHVVVESKDYHMSHSLADAIRIKEQEKV